MNNHTENQIATARWRPYHTVAPDRSDSPLTVNVSHWNQTQPTGLFHQSPVAKQTEWKSAQVNLKWSWMSESFPLPSQSFHLSDEKAVMSTAISTGSSPRLLVAQARYAISPCCPTGGPQTLSLSAGLLLNYSRRPLLLTKLAPVMQPARLGSLVGSFEPLHNLHFNSLPHRKVLHTAAVVALHVKLSLQKNHPHSKISNKWRAEGVHHYWGRKWKCCWQEKFFFQSYMRVIISAWGKNPKKLRRPVFFVLLPHCFFTFTLF